MDPLGQFKNCRGCQSLEFRQRQQKQVAVEDRVMLVHWSTDWADEMKTKVLGSSGYTVQSVDGSVCPGFNKNEMFVYWFHFK